MSEFWATFRFQIKLSNPIINDRLLIVQSKNHSLPQIRYNQKLLLSGPVEDLVGYIPDFGFELYDLHRFSDDEIKGNIISRMVLLLLKHIRDPDLQQKLPDILALLKTLLTEKETGLQWLEVFIRYIVSARQEEDLSAKNIVEIAEQAISKETGEYVMTLLEKLRNEGEERGEKKGKLEGLKEGIELGITYKFPGDIDAVMTEVNKINDLDMLKEITKAVHTAKDISEILALLK
jgi:predicted transposase YdaD